MTTEYITVLNPETGDRIDQFGRIVQGLFSPNDGRRYGSKPNAPITRLYQRGVIWSAAS